jgi:hypothetical protein
VHVNHAFLAGFVAGEGHFSITENNAGQSWCCGFVLGQRDDNADDQCSALATSLSMVPLLGKKAGDFRMWQRAVTAWNDPSKGALRWQRLARFAGNAWRDSGPSFAPTAPPHMTWTTRGLT